ncbi:MULTISPECIES: hypothetical protein [unclassified Xanthomonas]|uniref:hypothetical protein n=1 Tax=unclassified Xanthomonas TaxID=2643310 RepID=UPI002A822ABB|nr:MULTISPECIES: hypothetical protein [unclassified Xanthomonas]MDY4296810.1 hypothetical protein [Xanthomonas sp. LF02-5]MDY4358431.1 hypothetical protein [Xanthomonas sp. LF04-12]
MTYSLFGAAAVGIAAMGLLAYHKPRLFLAIQRPIAFVLAMALTAGVTWHVAVQYTAGMIIINTQDTSTRISDAAEAAQLPAWYFTVLALLAVALFGLGKLAKHRTGRDQAQAHSTGAAGDSER